MSQRRILKAGPFLLLLLILTIGWISIRPSNDRAWTIGQERTPYVTFAGSRLTIHNVRNFIWQQDGSAKVRWQDRTYDLDRLESVWFGLAPFERDNRGPAHTFLSFGFSDSQYVAISVEARRERNEDYSVLKGMLRRYEITYVIGDERDIIGLRSVRGDDIYLYPIRTTPAKARALFVEMLERANSLNQEPEFYNTLTNNCTTNILDHANSVSPGRIPYGRQVLLPGYADELAQRLGLIDSSVPIEQIRARYLINERARAFARDPFFSLRMREAPAVTRAPADSASSAP
ncbi:MAG: Lnb N-terminal periplasmic domain-containing protein [Gemmatimonadota bacterium]